MIDKLWRKKYEFVVDKNGQVVVKLDDGTYDIIWVWKDKPLQDFVVFSENGIKSIEDYCYFYDLIAQADKAERLQKALCFICNIHGAGMSYQDMFLDAHEVAKTALDPEHKPVLCGRYDEEMLDEIKQLIKGE